MSVIAGGMINLNENKTFFMDLALGHTIGAPTIQIGPLKKRRSRWNSICNWPGGETISKEGIAAAFDRFYSL